MHMDRKHLSELLLKDAATKNKESLEASEKVKELNKKIERAREDVKKLPGTSYPILERRSTVLLLLLLLCLSRSGDPPGF